MMHALTRVQLMSDDPVVISEDIDSVFAGPSVDADSVDGDGIQ